MDVLDDWKAARRPSEDSILRTERALRHLEISGQNMPLKDLKRTHGAAVRAYLLDSEARGFKTKTALNLWQALGALLNVALDVGKIESNPWKGMSFEVTDSKGRDPFSDEELQVLFGTTLHTHGQWPVVQKVDPWDAYFCMLLQLWTGARIGELAQLELADIKVQNGLNVFSIHEEAEGSTVKGGPMSASVRTLPVPPDLLRLGFLDRAERLREDGKTKLFPSFHRQGAVTPGEIMQEWFRPFRATIGAATGALNGTHRFRHTIRTRLAALHVGIETADALTGHAATGNAGRTRYTHVSPATVEAALRRVSWPMQLPRVFPKTAGG
jgi:integrase